jgi:hypothetical protein
MTKPLIIGVTGVCGSGKSLFAEYAAEHHGAAIISLAEPLKEMMLPLGFTHQQLFGESARRSEKLPATDLTCRKALEVVGDALITEHPRLFVDIVLRQAAECKAKIVVVPDARYYRSVPEMPAIREAGGKLVKRSTTAPLTSTHRTNVEHLELPDSYFDAVLPQFAEKTQLYDAIDELIARWTR